MVELQTPKGIINSATKELLLSTCCQRFSSTVEETSKKLVHGGVAFS